MRTGYKLDNAPLSQVYRFTGLPPPQCVHLSEKYSFTVATLVFNTTAHQTSLGKQQLDSCLAGSSPTGWTDLVEDLGDGRVVPGSHSILAQRLLNELQHRVLRRQNTINMNKAVRHHCLLMLHYRCH